MNEWKNTFCPLFHNGKLSPAAHEARSQLQSGTISQSSCSQLQHAHGPGMWCGSITPCTSMLINGSKQVMKSVLHEL